MGKFLADEKPKQAAFKAQSPTFSPAARADGVYKRHSRPFCLPRDCADENLLPEMRRPLLDYFARRKIKWHDGQDGKPSNHMCDSQVCCANFLFPFADKPGALAHLLRPVFPFVQAMLPIEDGQYVAFEWIGAQNYLGEKISRNGQRTRGANFTSADTAVMFGRSDGKKQIALIEWKYTEAYSSTSLKIAASGTDRTTIYAHLFNRKDCPLDKGRLPGFEALFFEPFYQFMRQQFLAHEMEKAHELGADVVSLLHIAPAHNLDFKRITSPALRPLGASATEVWQALVKTPDRFMSVSTEALFGPFDAGKFPALKAWREYVTARYSWLTEPWPM
jgi:hypothetical protein